MNEKKRKDIIEKREEKKIKEKEKEIIDKIRVE